MKPLLVLLLCLLWVSGFGLQHINWTDKTQKTPLKASIIQGNIPQDKKWLPESLATTKELYQRLTLNEWKNFQPDIVIWPESAIPTLKHQSIDYFDQLTATSIENNSTLITGLLFTKNELPPFEIYNGVYALDKNTQVYAKQRLVPFGEYIPLYDQLVYILPFLNNFPRTGISAGSPNQPGLYVKDFHLSPSICYEVMYPNLVQKNGFNSDFLFTISNDAWFGRSHGPGQHFQMARMRALELGKYMVRGTNNGITAIINDKGKVVRKIDTHQQGILRGAIPAAIGQTPFGIVGITPIILFCSIISILGLGCSINSKISLK